MHINDAFNSDKAKKDKSIFHEAIRKYGINNFDYEILEECDIDKLNEREIYWIQKLKSHVLEHGYNVTYGDRSYKKPYYFTDEELLYYWNVLHLTVTQIYQ